MRDSDFHLNVFRYPKRRQESMVVVESEPQLQQPIRRGRSNVEISYNRRAQKLASERKKLAYERKVNNAIRTYAQLRRNHSSIEATFMLEKMLHSITLALEISKTFEDALLKEFSKNGSAIVLKK